MAKKMQELCLISAVEWANAGQFAKPALNKRDLKHSSALINEGRKLSLNSSSGFAGLIHHNLLSN
jgi:hypothetical protein